MWKEKTLSEIFNQKKVTEDEAKIAIAIVKKYMNQLDLLIDKLEETQKEHDKDKRNIHVLNLETREYNALKAAEIFTVGDLVECDKRDLLRFRNLGKKGIEKINKVLYNNGINKSF